MKNRVSTTRLSGLAAAVTALVLVTGACGPDDSGTGAKPAKATTPASNGFAEKSAQEILSAATTAFKGATSVHLSGYMTEDGDSMSVDLRIGQNASRGTIEAPMNGKSYKLSFLSVDSKYYLKAPAMFRDVGGAAAAELIGNRWVLVPKDGSKEFGDFEKIVSIDNIADDILGDPPGQLNKTGTSEINGKTAVGLEGGDGVLYISTTEPHYPLKLVPSQPGARGEGLDFLDYNAPLTVTRPADAIDLGKLGG